MSRSEHIFQAEVKGEEDDEGWRLIKINVLCPEDVRTSDECMPMGWDSNPIPGMTCVYVETTVRGEDAVLGYYNRNRKAAPGEVRMYSCNLKEEELNYMWFRSDSSIEIGGDDDNMVRYSKLEEAFNQLKEDHDDLVSKYNDLANMYRDLRDDINTLKTAMKPVVGTGWIVMPGDGGAALQGAAAAWYGAPITTDPDDADNSTADITPAKIAHIKTTSTDIIPGGE